MQYNQALPGQSAVSTLEVSKVLRNTYALLAMTIGFSAITAMISMFVQAPPMGLLSLIPYFICLWMVEKNKNKTAGIFWVFALTGWLGFTIGPLLRMSIGMSGIEPVLMAFGGTAVIFFGLSGYVLVTRKDMSFLTGFIMTGFLVAFVAMIANIFLQIQGLYLALSCMFLLLSSAGIMWQTSAIIHGGERNYISATVTLYVMLYNIFTILLALLSGGDD